MLELSDVKQFGKLFQINEALYGDSKYENNVIKKILASINFILSTKRFEGQMI